MGSTISFRTAVQPLPMEHNPRKLFYRLFGQGDTAAEREAITAQTGSLLDLVSDEASSLRGQLGPADQARMAEYLDSVREIERQAQKMADQDFSKLDLPDAPAGVPQDFDEHINLMFDLAALAYRAGLTRIVSMMMAAEISMLTYNQVGVSEAFHPLSHHQNNADKMARLAVVQTYHSTVFARFLEKLKSTPDGDGSLLDHAILLYGSNMSDSNLHNANPLPSVVFGRGYGASQGGQHLKFAPDTPHANLMLTLLARAGVPVESLGNSTGDLATSEACACRLLVLMAFQQLRLEGLRESPRIGRNHRCGRRRGSLCADGRARGVRAPQRQHQSPDSYAAPTPPLPPCLRRRHVPAAFVIERTFLIVNGAPQDLIHMVRVLNGEGGG